MRFDIFDNNDNLLTSVASIEYSGSDMGACSITTTINSPAPLPLVHGCYILYRGEKYTLQNDATKKKQARIGSAGDAFVYENIVFDSVQADLVRCPMRDLVIADNGIHNCLPNFTFYDDGSLTQVRDRVQANLDGTLNNIREHKLQSAEVSLSIIAQCQIDISYTLALILDEMKKSGR